MSFIRADRDVANDRAKAIETAVARIVKAAKPSKVILFGSYARGDAGLDSDLDLLVIQREVPDRYAEMVRLRRAIGSIGIGVDVLVYSEEEVGRRSGVPGTVLYWAMKEGEVMYDAQS